MKELLHRVARYSIFCIIILSLSFPLASCQQDEGKRMFDYALKLWEKEKYDESIQNFIALTKAFPKHHLVDDSLYWIAKIYHYYLKEPKQAIRFYRSLNKTFVNKSEYYYNSMIELAQIYETQPDEFKWKAIKIYNKLQQLKISRIQWEQNQYKLAKIYFHLKQYESTRLELKNLIVNRPNSKYLAHSYYLIGFSYYLEGKIKLAELTFKETDKRFNYSRKSLPAALRLADIYEERGQLTEALAESKKMLYRLKRNETLYKVIQHRIGRLKTRLAKIRNQ
ncbi:MAG: TolA-binding protein [bacterium]|jgi:TolA-binding protein